MPLSMNLAARRVLCLHSIIGIVFGLVGILSPLSAEDSAASESALHEGTLPNGLRYVVVPHTSNKGDVGLRLVVHAGSLDEHDDERGFAHFVEHMAFNGTRRFPAGTIRYFFEGLGVEFGADLNANTSYTHTNYLLDLPEGKADRLDEALILLRDFADGMLFPPEEVTQESKVVLSELRARDSEGRRTSIEALDRVYAGTRVPDRDVIGLADQIEQASAEKLRAFYQRNYAPERMMVVVVGALDPAATIEKIGATFESMVAAPGAVAPAPEPRAPELSGVTPGIIVIPSSTGMSVQLIAMNARAPNTLEGHRQELIQRVATTILDNRLVARREAQTTRFGPAHARYDNAPVGPLVWHTLSVSTSADSWTDAVELLETELRRARVMGLTQAEVDEAAMAEINRVNAARNVPAATVANDVARLLSAHRTWKPHEAGAAEATQALTGLTADEANTELERIFPEDELHLIMTVPSDRQVRPERLLTAYDASAGRRLRESAGDVPLVFNYDDFGRPGKVASRTTVDDLGLTLVTFDNNVRLNLRPSSLEPGRFQLQIVFPQNYADVPRNFGGLSELAGQILLHSNLRDQKASEMSRLTKLHGIRPQFVLTNGTPVIAVSGPPDELPFAFKFLAALLSDVKFDNEHYGQGLSFYAGKRRSVVENPGPLAMNTALFQFLGNDPRVLFTSPQVFARTPPSQAEGWLRSHILESPLEIGLVGDFAVDDAIAAAAASVATLKRRSRPPRPGTPFKIMTTSARSEANTGKADSAAVSCVLWPVTLPDDPRHNVALSLAADVLQNRLVLALREILGAAYSPNVTVHRDRIQRDLAYVAMFNSLEPDRARQFTEGSIKLAGIMAERGVTPAEFARVREPVRVRNAEQLRNNNWWLSNVVSIAQSHPDALDDARNKEKLLDEITLEEVNEAAKVFQPGLVSVAIAVPEPEKS